MGVLKELPIESTLLLIPYGMKMPVGLEKFYSGSYKIIDGQIEYEEISQDFTICIYAPGLISVWLQSNLALNNCVNRKLLINHSSNFSVITKKIIKYRLLFEKIRLGSDVPSLYLQRFAHKDGYYHAVKDIHIADWLACFDNKFIKCNSITTI